MSRLPHPFPYQGSKRLLAPRIGAFLPAGPRTWFEPFAGSAAMSLWAARELRPERILISDAFPPLAALWSEILRDPGRLARRYAETHALGRADPPGAYAAVRERFNRDRDPADLLYLLCRCAKASVRFSRAGNFNQSADPRRLGMAPDRLARELEGASALLRSCRAEARAADWLEALGDAGRQDLIYLDPPYQGTSEGRDRRYAAGLPREEVERGVRLLASRGLRFALSYDGRTGERRHGEPLDPGIGLRHVELRAGRSSHATLAGRSEETVESLYLSPGLLEPDG